MAQGYFGTLDSGTDLTGLLADNNIPRGNGTDTVQTGSLYDVDAGHVGNGSDPLFGYTIAAGENVFGWKGDVGTAGTEAGVFSAVSGTTNDASGSTLGFFQVLRNPASGYALKTAGRLMFKEVASSARTSHEVYLADGLAGFTRALLLNFDASSSTQATMAGPALFNLNAATGVQLQVAGTSVVTTRAGRLGLSGTLEDGTGDTFYIGSDGSSLYPHKRAYFGTQGVSIGTGSGAIFTPNQLLDIRKNSSEACYAQFTNSTTTYTSGKGLLVGLDADEHGIINRQETAHDLRLQIGGVSKLVLNNSRSGVGIPITHTPASASATGVTGEIAWDSGFLYVCTATDTWKRAAITTWV